MPAPPVRITTRDDHAQRVLRALVHVQHHLDAALSLGALARVAHLSPFHFQRVFARIAGESPDAYVRRLRLERAARALVDGDEPVERLAGLAGHAHVESFTRSFRAAFGLPPAAYRARRRRTHAAPPGLDGLRVWVNRPARDAQPRLVPVPPGARGARDKRPPRIEQLMPLRVAFLRRVGAASQRHGEAADFRRLTAFANRRAGPVEDPVFLALHHDDPRITPAALRRLDRCMVVGPRRRGEGDIGVQAVGGGDYAIATHQGPRSAIPDVARWLEWTARTAFARRRREGAWIEVLLDDPRRAGARRAALVDLLVPVESPPAASFWYWLRRRPVAPR